MTRREELAFAVFSTWTVIGLFLDGWSHRVNKPEEFFTPYHAVLYSGVAAGVLWSMYESNRQRRAGEPIDLPAGSRLTGLGLAFFALGGAGDFVWHEVFGIEADTEALLSPTHLLLFIGGLALTTAPLRAGWATDTDDPPTFAAALPRLVGLALATAIVSFFTMFLHPFLSRGLREGETPDFWIAGLFVTTVVLLAPLLFYVRRWRPAPGLCTFHLTVVALLVQGLDAFDRPAVVVAAVAAGLVGDAVLGGGVSRSRAWLLGATVPAVLWSAYFTTVALTDGLEWTVELWAGATVVATLGGLGLAVLAFPPPAPAPDAQDGPVEGPVRREVVEERAVSRPR
jgi:hypothetical protein